MSDRLTNELIDVHARRLGWNRWRVTEDHEIVLLNIASNILGGIGTANGNSITLAKIAGPAIIVIQSLSIEFQLNAITNANKYINFNRNVKFLLGPTITGNTNILSQPSDFRHEATFSNGTNWYYNAILNSPEVFRITSTTQISATAMYSNPDTVTIGGWGRALVINTF